MGRTTQDEASQLHAVTARAELKASREEGGRLEAETSRDCLQVELNASEGRLVNRGAHVELLLRDKERLWGQLARARRRSANDDVKDTRRRPLEDAPDTPEKVAMPKRRSGYAGHTRPQSSGSRSSGTPSKGHAPRASSASNLQRACGQSLDDRSLELERQLWHLQRALERERAGHEQAREALRIRCWRQKPGMEDAKQQDHYCDGET